MSFIKDICGGMRAVALVITAIFLLLTVVGYFFMGIFVAMLFLFVLIMVLMALARPRY